jgi:hypothetical protein
LRRERCRAIDDDPVAHAAQHLQRLFERCELLLQQARGQAVVARHCVVRKALLMRLATAFSSNHHQRGRVNSNSTTKYSGTPFATISARRGAKSNTKSALSATPSSVREQLRVADLDFLCARCKRGDAQQCRHRGLQESDPSHRTLRQVFFSRSAK